jgi:hypothetical protein
VQEQWNRQCRQQHTALVVFFLPLVHLLAAQRCAYEALDSSGVPTPEPSAKEPGGCPAWRISAGATGWAGMKASTSCWPSTRLE